MASIPPEFWQMDPSVTPPFVQFGSALTVYFDGTINNDGLWNAFTASEFKLYLLLFQKAQTAPHGYLPTWQIVGYLYPTGYSDIDDPEHAVEQRISTMRRKLGEKRRKPRIIVGGRSKGYKLCIPKGCGSVPSQLLRKLLDMLNKR
jgi:DNA-binding response OmpR family regulator